MHEKAVTIVKAKTCVCCGVLGHAIDTCPVRLLLTETFSNDPITKSLFGTIMAYKQATHVVLMVQSRSSPIASDKNYRPRLRCSRKRPRMRDSASLLNPFKSGSEQGKEVGYR